MRERREGKGEKTRTHHTCLVLSKRRQSLQQLLSRRASREAGHKNRTVGFTITVAVLLVVPRPSNAASAAADSNARLTVSRALPKYDDLLSADAERHLRIRMQHAGDRVRVGKEDFCAASTRLYDDALDLAVALEDGADVGFECVGRQVCEADGVR
jgi:hypothetical protein